MIVEFVKKYKTARRTFLKGQKVDIYKPSAKKLIEDGFCISVEGKAKEDFIKKVNDVKDLNDRE